MAWDFQNLFRLHARELTRFLRQRGASEDTAADSQKTTDAEADATAATASATTASTGTATTDEALEEIISEATDGAGIIEGSATETTAK